MILDYNGKTPRIGANVFIAPTAAVIGDVEIGDNASIWFGAVVRGDMAPIRIGCGTNIQDNVTVHVDKGHPAIIGANVTVGHNAVVHGCAVEDDCLIGIGSVVLSGARIRHGCVVAAGAVVREGADIGPLHLVAGAPAVFKKALAPLPGDHVISTVADYLQLRADYRAATDKP